MTDPKNYRHGVPVKAMIVVFLAAAIVYVLATALDADAHYPTTANAQSTFNAYMDRECGDGSTWVCQNPRQEPASCYSTAGYHSRLCTGVIRERRVWWAGERFCRVSGRVEHGYVASASQDCW